MAASLRRFVESEFARVRRLRAGGGVDTASPQADSKEQGRDHEQPAFLVFEDILKLTSPPGVPVDFAHIGTIYKLDKDSQGKVSLEDLLEFIEFCDEQRSTYPPHEFKRQLQGFFTVNMWDETTQKGEDHLKNWMLRLICNNAPLHFFSNDTSKAYVHRQSVLPLYRVLKSFIAHELSFSELFDILQQAAEELNLLGIENEEMDELLPLVVVAELVSSCVDGFMGMMQEVGFTKSLAAPDTVHYEVSESAADLRDEESKLG